MNPVLPALAAAAVIGGIFLSYAGIRPVPHRPAPASRTRRRTRIVTSQTRILLLLGGLVGVVTWLTTGWVLAAVIAPAVIAGIPWLLTTPPTAVSIARLEAMEEWTRQLAGVLTVGVGLEQAIAATRPSAPAALRNEVDRLAARLNARWTTEAALRAFADDLDDATGDLITASLILAARRRGGGLSHLLTSLADTATAELRMRRAIETDRAKPRAAARWITVLTTGFLLLLGLLGSALTPYASPIGQVILTVLLLIFGGCLIALRRLTTGEALPRLLGADSRRPPTTPSTAAPTGPTAPTKQTLGSVTLTSATGGRR